MSCRRFTMRLLDGTTFMVGTQAQWEEHCRNRCASDRTSIVLEIEEPQPPDGVLVHSWDGESILVPWHRVE